MINTQISQNTVNLINAFDNVIRCGCMLINSDGSIFYNINSCGMNCSDCKNSLDCINMHRHAVFQTDQLGGKYMYLCNTEKIFCIAQIIGEDKIKYLIAGPMTKESFADKINDIGELLQATANHICGYEYKKLVAKQINYEKQLQINDYIQ
ncbi:MAG: hypothetical protein FWF15_09755, partial [Oscillospiraceae bacterium]|nr:hypothetical protein [Oscillospiraceae bacterium]